MMTKNIGVTHPSIVLLYLSFCCFLPQMITLGGDAELELVDSLDPFSEGVVFSVRPPKKSWKNIANLSGGEKVVWNSFDSTLFIKSSLFHKRKKLFKNEETLVLLQ